MYADRGLLRGRKSDYDKAIADSSEAIRLDPKSPRAYFIRGFYYAKKDDYDKAIADCSEAVRLDPKDAEAYACRGAAHARKRDYDKAIADYSEAIRLDPRLAIVYLDRGSEYVYKRDYVKAIADYSEAIRLNPEYGTAYSGLGVAHEGRGDHDGAIAAFSEAIRLDTMDATAYVYRGAVYERKRDYDKAIADYSAAVKLSPNSSYYYERRGAARIRRGDYEGGTADLQTAIRLKPDDPAAEFETSPTRPLSEGAIKDGEQQLRKMLSDRPAMAQFGEKAGILYRWTARKFAGEDLDAGKGLNERIVWDASEPPDADADSRIPFENRPGRIRIRKTYIGVPNMGREQSFERMWSDVVFEFFNLANARSVAPRIDRDAASGKLTKERYAREIIEQEFHAAAKARAFYIHVFLPWATDHALPTDPAIWFVAFRPDSRENLVRQNFPTWKHYEVGFDRIVLYGLVNNGENEKALDFATNMQAQVLTNEQNAEVFVARSIAQGQKGDRDAALRDLSEAIRLDPRIARAYTYRGGVYEFKDKYDKAIADYSEAIRLDPNDAQAYAGRGEAQGRKSEYDKAIADLCEAIRLDPKFARAYYTRGCAYERKGETIKAEADFREARELGYPGK